MPGWGPTLGLSPAFSATSKGEARWLGRRAVSRLDLSCGAGDALTLCVATPRLRNALACWPRKPIVALRPCRSSRHGGRNSIGDTDRTGNPPSAESLSRSDRDKAAAVQAHRAAG